MAAPATPTEEPEPLKPKRHHSNEPKPFEGLTHKPHCALCERETTHPQAPPPVPPDPMPPTNRRPRGEVYAVLRARKAGDLSEDAAIKRLERAPAWVWTAMDPTSKLLVVIDVGSPTLAMAQCVVHQVTRVLAPGCVPLFLTDGLKDYGTALLTHFGHWMQPERRQDKGPRSKPRWMPLPALLYTQVVKSYRRRRLVGVTHCVVFGTQLAIEQVLTACGWTINTAFVERLNLDLRQRVAAIGRRVNTMCQGEAGVREQLALFQVYHNFVVPHTSLRQPLLLPEATNGRGSVKGW